MTNNPTTLRFPNGDVYKGEVNADGKPHGHGTMDYKLNGYYATYKGEWENGQRSGKGEYERFSRGGGARYSYNYKGQWKANQPDGQGVEEDSREMGVHLSTVTETYIGTFKAGKRHGHGVLVQDNFDGSFTDGEDHFEGEFEEGRTVGRGVWKYANGDSFEGSFIHYGTKQGHGIYTFSDGTWYEAEWNDNTPVLETIKPDPSLKTPLIIVSEHHEGFDYNRSASFLFFAREGFIPYEQTSLIYKDSSIKMKGSGLEILDVQESGIRFRVQEVFTRDGKALDAAIGRGENRKFEDFHNATATIYDEDYDYTIGSSLEISCR